MSGVEGLGLGLKDRHTNPERRRRATLLPSTSRLLQAGAGAQNRHMRHPNLSGGSVYGPRALNETPVRFQALADPTGAFPRPPLALVVRFETIDSDGILSG